MIRLFRSYDNRSIDAIYVFSFTVPHSLSTLKLTFTAKGLTPELLDEGWGIDNIAVYTIK